MRILWDNEYDNSGNTITANSESSVYGLENLDDYQLVKVYRSTGDSAEWVKIDAGAGSTITATCAAICSHNLTDGATIKIQGNDTDAWATPTVDESFTHDSGNMVKTFTSATHRYWRFSFADGSNPDGYIEIGRLFLGTYLTLDTPYTDFPYSIIDTSVVDSSITGQSYGDEGITLREYSFNWNHFTNTEKENIVTMFEDVKTVKPVVIVPDPDNTDKLVIDYVRITELSLTHWYNYAWKGRLNFLEVK